MRASALRLLCAAALLAAEPPALAQPLACADGQAAASEIELFFGRRADARLAVTQARFAEFLDREITPRFPDGLTVLDATGQWRDPQGSRTMREPTKVVIIVVPDAAAAKPRIDAVVEAYKRRFRQRSVGVVTRPVCASF